MAVSILGIGHELPPASEVGATRRPRVAEACGPSRLALAACDRAFAEAEWTAASVDMIVFATMTPDVTFPGAGCFLQDALAADTVGALDIRGQCAGFLMGLAAAVDLIEAGKSRRALLAGAEVHSSALDYSEQGLEVAELYGDGGGVFALAGEGKGIAEVGAVVSGADGTHYDRFWCEFPSSRRYPTRMMLEDYQAGKHFIRIDRDHVAEFGRAKLPEVIDQVVQVGGVALADVDLFVLSHIFPEVAEDAARARSLASDRLVVASAEHGHLTAGSLPVALDLARRDGRIGSGAKVCLASCGAGYAWGAALLEFS